MPYSRNTNRYHKTRLLKENAIVGNVHRAVKSLSRLNLADPPVEL